MLFSIPDKTYHVTDGTIGNKICEDCYQFCEKCLISGNNTYMNCLNCPENHIYYEYNHYKNLKNCYLINDNFTKTFFAPYNDEIISCKDLNKYIIENTNECID